IFSGGSMNLKRASGGSLSIVVTMFIVSFPMAGFSAGALNQVIAEGASQNKDAAASQKRVEKLDDESRRMLQEFRQNTRNAEVLKSYNDHLEQLVRSQEDDRKSLEDQFKDIEVTRREIVPLMLRMLETLEAFVGYDLPFLPDERKERIEHLKQLMLRADVSHSEKFRRVLEAYQVEAEYGRTIEAYRADLNLPEGQRPVDFLRLGRVALYYQTLDGRESGIWNPDSKQWDPLPERYQRSVREGLRVARKEAAPDLLTLPIPAPEAVE
ncbi:MAG: DUF3450 domain-containing protein, partial [Gammaproteobacteria bacterium]